MAFCGNCGSKMEDSHVFCPECGFPVAKPVPAPVVEEPVPVQPAPEPAVEKSVPVQPAPEPVVEEPVPVQPAPEPVVEEPVPAQPAPEPVVEEPVPVQPVPEPVVEEPTPVRPAPEPVVEEPAPVVKKEKPAKEKQVKPPKEKKAPKEKKVKPPKQKKQGPSVLLQIGKVAVLVLVIAALIGGIVGAMYLSLRPAPKLDTPSGEKTMGTDGVLSVSLRYEKNALLFGNSKNARMNLVLTNVSDDIIRDLSVNLTYPDSLRYTGAEEEIKADVIAPGASYTVSLPVEQVVAMDNNFTYSLLILGGTGVLLILLVVLYAVLCGKYAKQARAVLVCLLLAALLLPSVAPIVQAAQAKSKLIYEEGSELATAISTTRTTTSKFKLGDSGNTWFSYAAEYSQEQRLALDASLSEDGESVVLQWNEISDADAYRIYFAEYGEEFTELATVDTTEYRMDAPGSSRIWKFRVAAQTKLGDLYTNDLQFMVSDSGKIFSDNDGDLLSNELEGTFGTSLVLADTDGDGISDYDEVAVTMTDPLKNDSDGNGIPDGEEDPDQDGLTNLKELEIGTLPLAPDSDDDGIYDQIEHETLHTDPLNADTDGDGLYDGSECDIGTDPTKADTDGNGINDAEDTHAATIGDGVNAGVKLDITETGDRLTAVEVQDITESTVFSGEEYIASPIVKVEVPENTEATITLPVSDPTKKDDVVIVVYNEDDNDFRVLEDSVVSADGTSVSTTVSSEYVTTEEGHTDGESTVTMVRSTYVALYIANWHAMFQAPLSPDRDGNVFFDVSFVIDESSSMEDNSKGTVNDPNRYRVEAAKRFTEALIAGDRAAVVGFNDTARRKIELSEDMDAVRTAIDSIVGNAGGTALYAGLQEALTELINTYTDTRGRFIIALTDGEDSSSNDAAYDQIIADCVEYQIPIYTIGLGSSVNTSLLTQLATYTGGCYIHIQTADDLPQVFNRIENNAFYGDDTDGDGLADSVEEHGLRDGTGAVYFTDATLRFTDGDDLSDGEEAGNVMYTEEDENGNTLAYYLMLTDPSKADTDGDGVDDLDEKLMKTLPWCSDTDGDGLSDGLELSLGYDPVNANPDGDAYIDSMEKLCSDWSSMISQIAGDCGDEPETMVLSAIISSIAYRDPYTYDLSGAEKGVALLEGALLGDFGDMLAQYGIMDSRHTGSVYYYIGGIIIGLIPVASAVAAVRDAIACAIQGDVVGAVLNLIGIIPGGGSALKALKLIAEIVKYAGDGAEAALEYPTTITVQKAAAAPALTYVLLRLYRMIEDAFKVDLGTDDIKNMVNDQIDMGLQGLIKDNVQNWEAFLTYGESTDWSFEPHRSEDALTVVSEVQLPISNMAQPIELVQAVRTAFQQVPGGQITVTETGAEYCLVRAFDLECTEYQDAIVLENAIHDAVDRAAGYIDVNHSELSKRVQLVFTDSLVSERVYNVLQDIQSYADEKGVAVECHLYLTTDDNNYNTNLEGITPADEFNKNAIIILPGIAGSELVAGEDYSGGVLNSVAEGENVWLPEVATKALNLDIGAAFQDLGKDALLEVSASMNMLQLDSRGNALYHLQAKAPNQSNGALNCAKAMREALVDNFDATYDVVMYSYDWRKSVATAAMDLQSYIDKRGYESVTFVCHSMGGIVCSYYLTLSEENVAKTRQVITVGTPYGGSPKAAYVFETGDFLGFNVPLLTNAFQQLSRNYPSVYELLPYNDSIRNNGSYLYQDGAPLDPTATQQYLENCKFELNDQMIQNAISVQNKLYPEGKHIMNSDAVNCTIIAGYNEATVTKLHVGGDQITSTGISMAGDGTVPLVSAIESDGALFDNPIYLVEGVGHMALFGDDNVIKLVVNLIDSSKGGGYDTSVITQPTADELTADDICSREKDERGEVSNPSDGVFQDVYDVFIAYCPVQLSLYDAQGKLVGSVSSKGVDVEDPADQNLFCLLGDGETKQVVVPEGHSVKITGEEDGTMDVKLATMNAAGEMMQSFLFPGLDVNPKMDVEVTVKDHEPTIVVDANGDGRSEQTLTAEDGQKEVYIPLDSGNGTYTTRLWILIGVSGGLVLLTALALILITLITRPKKAKKK